jgi:hypothetical protein
VNLTSLEVAMMQDVITIRDTITQAEKMKVVLL